MDMTMIEGMLTPELLPLIPVLYFIGMALRQFEKLENKYIPIILGMISILLTGLYTFSTVEISTYSEVLGATLTVIIQGVLFAGSSVYADQLIKQSSNNG